MKNNKWKKAVEIFCNATLGTTNADCSTGSLFCKLKDEKDFNYFKKSLKGFFKFYNNSNVKVKGYKLDGNNYVFDFI
jgi:hypothetical protein